MSSFRPGGSKMSSSWQKTVHNLRPLCEFDTLGDWFRGRMLTTSPQTSDIEASGISVNSRDMKSTESKPKAIRTNFLQRFTPLGIHSNPPQVFRLWLWTCCCDSDDFTVVQSFNKDHYCPGKSYLASEEVSLLFRKKRKPFSLSPDNL